MIDSTHFFKGPQQHVGVWTSWLAVTFRRSIESPWLAVVVLLLAIIIFVIDTQTPQPVAVLYAAVLLVAARSGRREWVIWTSLLSVILTLLSYIAQNDGPRFAIRIVAIGIVTFLILRNLAASRFLSEQARLLDQTHDSVCVCDLNGVITSWNRGAELLFGWSSEEACGAISQDLLKTDLPVSRDDLTAILLENGYWEGELLSRSKDGKALTLNSRWSLLRDERSRPKGILKTSNDITHREEADEAVRRSETRYRTIFQTTGVSIWECDISAVRRRISDLYYEGVVDLRKYLLENPNFVREAIDLTRVVDVNDATIRMFGARTKWDLLGPMGPVWPVVGEQAFAEAMLAVCENQPIFETEATLQTIDGLRLDVLFTTALPPEAASRETIFLSLVDITSSNRARLALQSAQADLAHATRLTSLDELTASIAHEVNQPLAGILANGQAGLRWLRRDTPDIEAAIVSLEKLVGDAKRASSVIGGIQALARNEAPKQVRLDLNDIVRESLVLLDGDLKRCSIELFLDLTSSRPHVRADRIQVQQVIINLVVNAAQAMSDTHDGLRRLRISTSTDGSAGTVKISDTGPGIDSNVRSRLFTAFTTTKINGMGLGLSICASIIARQGGRISADSNDENGAVFTFSLPIHEDENEF
ncbi:ATP-binding protein [Bradyrhizobium sp. LA2.1]|uniref:PAS domain-containing sensor histidine kinase n=1 Tax=Bradyrhizobium sp. LA2.1 TaxID=3156376 RepID=UPI003399408F